MDSPRLQLVKDAFRLFCEEGVEAGVEGLLSISHPQCEFRPHVATGRVLRGTEETRAFFLENGASRRSFEVHPHRFEEEGESVIVSGSIRVHHAGGGFAESQVRWTYRFKDGLVEAASWEPRCGSNGLAVASAEGSSPPSGAASDRAS